MTSIPHIFIRSRRLLLIETFIVVTGALFLLFYSPVTPPLTLQGKLIVIGIDGLSWTPLLPMLNAGRLPTIKTLMVEGSYGDLKSDRPDRTTQVWTTIASGVLANKHTINGRYRLEQGRERMTMSTDWDSHALWHRMTARKIPVIIVGWPVSWPALPVRGTLATDMLFPAWGSFEPQELSSLPRRVYPEHLLHEMMSVGENGSTQAKMQHNLLTYKNNGSIFQSAFEMETRFINAAKSDGATAAMALYLFQKQHPAVTMVYLGGFHPVIKQACRVKLIDEKNGAIFPGDEPRLELIPEELPTVEAYLLFLDSLINQFVQVRGANDTIMIVSGRGMVEGSIDNVVNDPYVALPFGMFIFSGPPIKSNNRPVLAGSLEIAPTLLYLAGLPLDINLDGGVMMLALKEELSFHQRVSYEGDRIER